MQVKFKRFHPDAKIPEQGSALAGGWDVTCTEIIQESPDFVICKLGFALQPDYRFKITLVPRSSLTKTKWILQNSPGLGDADFLGEYQYRFRALPNGFGIEQGFSMTDKEFRETFKPQLVYPAFPFKVGDRIGQIYLEEVIPMDFIEVDELTETDRGHGAFGSTGS